MDDPQEVLTRAAAGDPLAWRDIVRRYQRLVFATIRTYRIQADDAQEAFLRLHRHAARVQDARALARWMIVTTRNLCLDHIGRRRSSARLAASLDTTRPESEAEIQEHLELAQDVREALEDLPPRCRELLWLLYFEQERPNYAEAGRRLRMPLGSIGPTRARCFERLIRILRARRARERA
jgi:RNA polymerase sigma factor (sigma-70 family)